MWRGGAWRGTVGFGKACTVARRGRARFGTDRWGKVWQGVHRGLAGRGWVWLGGAGHGSLQKQEGDNGKNSEDSKE